MVSFLIKLVLLAIFNISFFTVTKAECTVPMWISYSFIHFAFIMFFLSPLFTKKSKSRHVAIESVALITALYFIATLAVGLFFLVHPYLVLYQYSIESFITGVYLIVLIISIVINNNIAKNENQSEEEKLFINNIFVKAEFLKTKTTDASIIKQLEDLQEESRYSSTKSSLSVKEYEKQILSNLDEITLNIEKLNTEELVSNVSKTRDLLKQRNLVLKKGL